MKKTRTIKTFEIDPEVGPALEKAQKAGLSLRDIMNRALKEFHRKGGIQKLAKERAETLSSLSFNGPELPVAGFAE